MILNLDIKKSSNKIFKNQQLSKIFLFVSRHQSKHEILSIGIDRHQFS